MRRVVQGALDETRFAALLKTSIRESGVAPKQNIMLLVGRYNLSLAGWQAVRSSVGWSSAKNTAFQGFRAAKEKLAAAVAFDSDLGTPVHGDFIAELKAAADLILAAAQPPAGLGEENILENHPVLTKLQIDVKKGDLAEAVQTLQALPPLYSAAEWWRAIKAQAAKAGDHPGFKHDVAAAAKAFKIDFRANRVSALAGRQAAIEKLVKDYEEVITGSQDKKVEVKLAEPSLQRISGIPGRGAYIKQTDTDFVSGSVGFTICKITGTGGAARAAMIGGIGKGSGRTATGLPAAFYKAFDPSGSSPFPRARHGEDDWFIQYTGKLAELKGGSYLEVLDSAVPCDVCMRLYILPLRRYAGVPVFVYTFRDDHHSDLKQVAYEVTETGLKFLGKWSDS